MTYKLYDVVKQCFINEDYLSEESIIIEIENILFDTVIQIYEYASIEHTEHVVMLCRQSFSMSSDFAKTILARFNFINILISNTIHDSIKKLEFSHIVMVNIFQIIDNELYRYYPKYDVSVQEMRLFFEINPKIINFLETRTNTINKNFCFFETNDTEKIIINKLIKDNPTNFDYHIFDKKTLDWK